MSARSESIFRPAVLIIGAGIMLSAMGGLQISKDPLITYADLLLCFGAIVLAPSLLTAKVHLSPAHVAGSLLLVCVALTTFVRVPNEPTSTTTMLRLVYAIVLLPLLFAMWRPAPRVTATLALAYVVGACASAADAALFNDSLNGRAAGLAPHPNGLGIASVFAITFLPYLANVFHWVRRVWPAFALLLVMGIWLSGSRAALVSAALLIVMIVLYERSARAALGVLMAATGLIVAWPHLGASAGSNAVARLGGSGGADKSDIVRQQILADTIAAIREHPIGGNGFSWVRTGHDAFLQCWVAFGFIGMFGFALVLAGLVSPLLQRRHEAARLAYVAAAFVVLGLTSDNLLDTLVWAPVSLAVLARRVPMTSHCGERSGGSLTRPNASVGAMAAEPGGRPLK